MSCWVNFWSTLWSWLITSTQTVTSILRWWSTDDCVPSPSESGSCAPFSSITTDCWSRSSSPERYVCKSFKYKAHGFLQLVLLCLLVQGAAGVCGSQWSGLSTKKKVTIQDSCWNAGAKGEKKTEPHIKGGQNWVWRQQRFIWWWWSVFSTLVRVHEMILALV